MFVFLEEQGNIRRSERSERFSQQRTGRPPLAEPHLAGSPAGPIPSLVGGGGAGLDDSLHFAVISWMRGRKHHADPCVRGLCDFLFTFLYLSTEVLPMCVHNIDFCTGRTRTEDRKQVPKSGNAQNPLSLNYTLSASMACITITTIFRARDIL